MDTRSTPAPPPSPTSSKKQKKSTKRAPEAQTSDVKTSPAAAPPQPPQERAQRRRQPPPSQQQQSAIPNPTTGGNRAKAQKTLLLLGQKEQELMYALEDMTDRVEEQRQIVAYCQRHAPFRLMAERMRERELEEDQVGGKKVGGDGRLMLSQTLHPLPGPSSGAAD